MPRTQNVGAGGSEVQSHKVILGGIGSLRGAGDTGEHVWWGEWAEVKFPDCQGPEGVTDPLDRATFRCPAPDNDPTALLSSRSRSEDS